LLLNDLKVRNPGLRTINQEVLALRRWFQLASIAMMTSSQVTRVLALWRASEQALTSQGTQAKRNVRDLRMKMAKRDHNKLRAGAEQLPSLNPAILRFARATNNPITLSSKR
jgi:hypothetical protein